MAQHNPFAPPSAEVADVHQRQTAPALWNPGAAASWSLLFSPIFGSYLHARNWEALGQTEKAASSRKWMLGSIVFFGLVALSGFVFPESKATDAAARLGSLVLLISWYYAIGKSQQGFVAARFGKTYPRRGWLKPLLAALGVIVAFIVAMAIVGFAIGGLTSAIQGHAG